MNICAIFGRKNNRHVLVTMTVVRTVVKVVERELLGSSTREEVRGPWAATTGPMAKRRRTGSLVRIVGRGEERW